MDERGFNEKEMAFIRNVQNKFTFQFHMGCRFLHFCGSSFGDYPEKAGNFDVVKGKETLKKISFNYPRTESNLSNINTTNFDTFTKVNTIGTVLKDIASERTSSEVWKWFLLATLLLLFTELLIQKLIK